MRLILEKEGFDSLKPPFIVRVRVGQSKQGQLKSSEIP